MFLVQLQNWFHLFSEKLVHLQTLREMKKKKKMLITEFQCMVHAFETVICSENVIYPDIGHLCSDFVR